MAAEKPAEVYERNGRDVAMWGVMFPKKGQAQDPVPVIFSSAYVNVDGTRDPAAVELFGEVRLSLDLAEALADRIVAAVRYERARQTEGPVAP